MLYYQLVTNYDSNPQITQYVKNLTWYITPVVNPDGYEYSRSSGDIEVRTRTWHWKKLQYILLNIFIAQKRLWRKNRSTQRCRGRSCCQGVKTI